MQIGDVTISTAIAWLIGAAAGLVTLSKAVELIKGIFHKHSGADTLKRHAEMLDRDNKRLQALEEDAKERDRAQAVMFRGILSIINHELTGNGDETLRKSRDEINDYLTGR